MTRALVIGRRRKGRPIGHAINEAGAALLAAGWTVEHELVDRKRELRRRTRAAVEADVDVVVVVGGDGAVLQVIQELAGTPVALGIVPMGTGNLVAGNLGIAHRRDRAIEIALEGHSRRIDLGRVTVGGKHELFAVACGIGFDAEVMDGTRTEQKLRWGKLAYVASAIRQSRRVRNVTHEITLDGVRSTMKASQVFIANFGRMGLAIEPRLKVEPDDGMLDVIVVRASGPLPGLLAGWEALRQTELGESPAGNAFRARARKIRVRTSLRRLVEVDGSVIGTTPIKASIRPASLTVLVPRT